MFKTKHNIHISIHDFDTIPTTQRIARGRQATPAILLLESRCGVLPEHGDQTQLWLVHLDLASCDFPHLCHCHCSASGDRNSVSLRPPSASASASASPSPSCRRRRRTTARLVVDWISKQKRRITLIKILGREGKNYRTGPPTHPLNKFVTTKNSSWDSVLWILVVSIKT